MGPAAGFSLAEESPALDAAVAKQGRGSDLTVLRGSRHWRLEWGWCGGRPTETGNIQGFQTFCHIVVYLGGEDHPRRPGTYTLKTTQWVLISLPPPRTHGSNELTMSRALAVPSVCQRHRKGASFLLHLGKSLTHRICAPPVTEENPPSVQMDGALWKTFQNSCVQMCGFNGPRWGVL